MLNAPVKLPFTAGVNSTPAEQLDPALRLPVHVVLATTNGELIPRVIALRLPVPVLVINTPCTALVWPGATIWNVICDGLTLRAPGAVPVPLRGTEAGATPLVDEEITRVAALPPVTAGVKTTFTVQSPPLARVAPQVVEAMEKLEADWPMNWKPTLASGAPPLLETVTNDGELAWPTGCIAKLNCAGETLSEGGCKPEPLRATVCVRAKSATLNVPGSLPG
jgi:hypothetical protein